MQGRLASGEDIFGPLIRKYLLDNKHRVSVEMLPDKDLAAQREAAERDRLATVRSAMGPEDIEAVIKETRELKERQVRPSCLFPEHSFQPPLTNNACNHALTSMISSFACLFDALSLMREPTCRAVIAKVCEGLL